MWIKTRQKVELYLNCKFKNRNWRRNYDIGNNHFEVLRMQQMKANHNNRKFNHLFTILYLLTKYMKLLNSQIKWINQLKVINRKLSRPRFILSPKVGSVDPVRCRRMKRMRPISQAIRYARTHGQVTAWPFYCCRAEEM